MSEPLLCIWVVYSHPTDYPDHYVVRRQYPYSSGEIGVATVAGLYGSLKEARADIPEECLQLDRDRDDDPKIVECWL